MSVLGLPAVSEALKREPRQELQDLRKISQDGLDFLRKWSGSEINGMTNSVPHKRQKVRQLEVHADFASAAIEDQPVQVEPRLGRTACHEFGERQREIRYLKRL